MDAITAEKIGKLAKQLKKFNMAASMDEATARAGEIIKGPPCDDTPISKLMKIELTELKKQVKEDDKVITDIRQELDSLKTKETADDQQHSAEKKKFRKAKEKSDKLKESVDDMETVTDVAEDLQNE